jgi:hypothetical protein
MSIHLFSKPMLKYLFITVVSSLALPDSNSPRVNFAQLSLVHEFPKPTWLENLAVMRNGSILVTELTKPRLWLLHPFQDSEPTLIHEFSGYLGLLGVVETDPDVFAVVSGNFSLEVPTSYPGTYSSWTVDMKGDTNPANVKISKIADIPQASFLNGISYLGKSQNALLHADSTLGVVFRQDIDSGKTVVAIEDPLMKKCSPDVLEGINGMKIYDGHVYFSNSDCGFLARLPIHANGTAMGPSSIIAYSDKPKFFIYDDFAVDVNGDIYAAAGNENIIQRVSRNGRKTHVAGSLNTTEVAEPTALAFGRTMEDTNVVYVTTGGAIGDPINGTVVVGGQLLAITLDVSH